MGLEPTTFCMASRRFGRPMSSGAVGRLGAMSPLTFEQREQVRRARDAAARARVRRERRLLSAWPELDVLPDSIRKRELRRALRAAASDSYATGGTGGVADSQGPGGRGTENRVRT
jgi:hypothetical protein